MIETVLGMQFDPLPGLRSAHLGAFWKRLGREWPHVSDVPPLEPQFERFEEARSWTDAGLRLRLTQEMRLRLQICSAAKDRMIQVQNGRLHYNWLGQGGADYPRYGAIRPEFNRTLAEFRDFLADESIGPLRPNQWEVTYVNHIPRGVLWDSPSDWGRFLRLVPVDVEQPYGLQLESHGGGWHFEIEPQLGRLHIHLRHGHRGKEKTSEVLVMTLTARGPVQGANGAGLSLEEGIDCGRAAIVRAFAAITSETAHEHWGITHATV